VLAQILQREVATQLVQRMIGVSGQDEVSRISGSPTKPAGTCEQTARSTLR